MTTGRKANTKILTAITATLLATLMAFAIAGCGSSSSNQESSDDTAATETSSDTQKQDEGTDADATQTGEASEGMANPVVASDKEGVTSVCGVALSAPEVAENPAWSYINMGQDQQPIAQLTFTSDGCEITYRGQRTSSETAEDITGIYVDWQGPVAGKVAGATDAEAFTAESDGVKYGYVRWIFGGINYCISIQGDVDTDALFSMATLCWNASA